MERRWRREVPLPSSISTHFLQPREWTCQQFQPKFHLWTTEQQLCFVDSCVIEYFWCTRTHKSNWPRRWTTRLKIDTPYRIQYWSLLTGMKHWHALQTFLNRPAGYSNCVYTDCFFGLYISVLFSLFRRITSQKGWDMADQYLRDMHLDLLLSILHRRSRVHTKGLGTSRP